MKELTELWWVYLEPITEVFPLYSFFPFTQSLHSFEFSLLEIEAIGRKRSAREHPAFFQPIKNAPLANKPRGRENFHVVPPQIRFHFTAKASVS